MKMLVLGAGLQGSACAYDLLQQPQVATVTIADKTVAHLPAFLAPYLGKQLTAVTIDVRDEAKVTALMQGHAACMSAIPYYFNLAMARCAVEAGVHFSDLGGNTEIVFQQKGLNDLAVKHGVTVVPDCGVAPGMVNILAEQGIASMDTVSAVRIFVGGLPQQPEPPLNYQIVYSLEGVLDYYTTLSWVLRDGKRHQVPALSERVPVDFPAPVGSLEAFHTAGGLSTMAFRYEGKIPTMEYKTLRYPGHAELMASIRSLGLLDLEPVTTKDGTAVIPRDAFVATVGPRLTKPDGRDLVALRVTVEGTRGGERAFWGRELIDYFDAAHGISAMMRCTGYSLSITGLLQAAGEVRPAGVHTPDECMPAEKYVAELAARGVAIREMAAPKA
ncbi:MAG: saccharopine dehydrogenase NADP-binding domain-containing protein [Gemmatimonadetes bacterium]|nr:saccharopine dehydrogenase NADP-binding domain-containing protein [Gemmatimonadota bacterium]